MTTLVFPGQGSQYVGMARDFYDNFESAKNTFELVEEPMEEPKLEFKSMVMMVEEMEFEEEFFESKKVIYIGY